MKFKCNCAKRLNKNYKTIKWTEENADLKYAFKRDLNSYIVDLPDHILQRRRIHPWFL